MVHWQKLTGGLLIALSALLAVSFARPFAGSWNDGSRLATVESLVDRHTWMIDESIFVQTREADAPDSDGTPLPYSARDRNLLAHGTQDKLFIGGHYYSDKSPVPALLMAGVYQLWHWAAGMTTRGHPEWFCWILTATFSGMSYVIAVWCVYRLTRRLNLVMMSQLVLTSSFALATVALPYTRHVNNHVLLLAVSSALTLGVVGLREDVQIGRICCRRFAFLGFLAGLGYTIDLGVGPVILICTGILVLCYSFGRERFIVSREPMNRARLRIAAKRTAFFAVSALPWLILHHALNYAIAGSLKPANVNPEYFRWPGSPFAVENLTGTWIHPHLGSFLLYAASMLAGKRGFFGHNLPLFLTIAGLVVLIRHHREWMREVAWAFGCCAGAWLLYAATSNNSSGQCCTIRWFVPLLAPAYFILALLVRHRPDCRLDLVMLSGWGMLLVALMRQGPWMGGMVPFFWPIQAAALGSWGLSRYLLRRRALVRTTLHPYTNDSGNFSAQEERSRLWITTRSLFGAHASTTSATSTLTFRATSSSSSRA